jgi:MraZ protein
VGQSGKLIKPLFHKDRIMLIGEFTHTLDDKKRISLPTKLRKELGKSVVVAPGLDSCLFLFTVKDWAHIADKLSSGSMLEENTRSFSRYLFGQAMELSVDTAGRILIPENLRELAGLTQKAVFVGVKTRMEVWSEEKWTAYKKGVGTSVDKVASQLGSLGVL